MQLEQLVAILLHAIEQLPDGVISRSH